MCGGRWLPTPASPTSPTSRASLPGACDRMIMNPESPKDPGWLLPGTFFLGKCSRFARIWEAKNGSNGS